jgi:ketosteroid isomerase-like protein
MSGTRPSRGTATRRRAPAALLALVLALLLAALPLLAGARPAAAQRAERDDRTNALRREIAARFDTLLAAFRRDDPRAMAAVFAEDGTIRGPQEVRAHGRDAIERYWLSRPRAQAWEIEILEIGGGTDAPWTHARSIRMVPVEGRTERRITEFIVVWKRDRDGVLRIYLDLYT